VASAQSKNRALFTKRRDLTHYRKERAHVSAGFDVMFIFLEEEYFARGKPNSTDFTDYIGLLPAWTGRQRMASV